MNLILSYWPDTSPTELRAVIDSSEVSDERGNVSEARCLARAATLWPEHTGGWVSWDRAPEDVEGCQHARDPHNLRRCILCNAWPLA